MHPNGLHSGIVGVERRYAGNGCGRSSLDRALAICGWLDGDCGAVDAGDRRRLR